MKAKFLTVAMILLACAAPARSQSQQRGRLLPKTITLDATSDVTVNATLNRGFILSGTIANDSDHHVGGVHAVSTTTSATFTAITPSDTYRIFLPPNTDTYNLEVGGVVNGVIASYMDSTSPTPFTVSGDTVRDITAPPPPLTPSPATANVSNMITHQSPNCGIPALFLDSTAYPGYLYLEVDIGNGLTFRAPLGGTFNAQLIQYLVVPNSCGLLAQLTSDLGPVTVTNPLNLTAPTITTATLSGTVSIAGGASPSSGSLQLIDISQPPAATTISSAGCGFAETGAGYCFTVVAGNSYALTWSTAVAGLGTYSPSVTVGTINGDTVFNPTFPTPPGPVSGVTVSGRVTVAGILTPVPFALVSVSGSQITGAANTSFTTSVKTDASGNYSLVVPAGTNYTLTASGQLIAPGDFDQDGTTDIAVWRPSSGGWWIIPSGNPGSPSNTYWGQSGDIPVPGHYGSVTYTNNAVWRPSNGIWYIGNTTQQWGLSGDIPVQADYDGDGKTDIAVWRPSEGNWYILPSTNPGSPIVQQWGLPGDIPVPGDYDGDGKTDFAIWRPSSGQWFIVPSSNPGTPIVQSWGLPGDVPVPGDYDGDGKTDFAIWRPSSGQWFIIPSSNPGTPIVQSWGLNGDVPVPGDYDGDGITDLAVWRPSSGQWFVIPSTVPTTPTVTSWGLPGDIPVQKPIGY